MSDKHAARKGDDIIHASVFADITSIVAEGLAYAAIGAAVGFAVSAAAPLLVAAGASSAAATAITLGSSCVFR
ncbi:hypothetical protein KXR87_22985, partial [Yokenella regensburgei]|uniref:hypothetical protein n=1 Tax=Yokenella regensburgei TaxID=158877 RepID=UPI003F19130C